MNVHPASTTPALASVIRLAWGGVLLAAVPDIALAIGSARKAPYPGPARALVWVLGARYCVQAGIELRWTGPKVLALAAAVDGVHAGAGLVLAAVASGWRRPGISDAAVAVAFTVATARNARHQSRSAR